MTVWFKEDPEMAAERVVEAEMEIYKCLLEAEKQLNQIKGSKAYRFGKMLLKPFSRLKR